MRNLCPNLTKASLQYREVYLQLAVILIQCDSVTLLSLPILRDDVVLLEGCYQMFNMLFAYILG